MSPNKERYNFLIDVHQREGLRRIKVLEGIPESEQIRRAIDEWLGRHGLEAGRKRVIPAGGRARAKVKTNR